MTLFFLNGRLPHYFFNKIIKQPKTFKIETMVVAPLRVTLFDFIYGETLELRNTQSNRKNANETPSFHSK